MERVLIEIPGDLMYCGCGSWVTRKKDGSVMNRKEVISVGERGSECDIRGSLCPYPNRPLGLV